MPPWLVIVATLVVQSVLLSIAFPISELLTHVPLLYNDNAYHLYQMKLGHVFADTGALIGYDPTFAAGYPGGILYNWSAKLPWLLAAGSHGLVDDIVLYKVYVFLCGVLGPVCIPLAVRRLGASVSSMALGAALAIILWWASWFHWMFTEGMMSFVTGSYLSVPYLVEIIRYLEGEGSARRPVALGVGGAALFFFHPLFPLAIAVGTLLSILLRWTHVALNRVLLVTLVVPALSLLPNIPWLIATRQYASGEFWTAAGAYFNTVDANLLWKELIGVYRGNVHGSKAYPAILCLVLAAHLLVRERAARRQMQIFTLVGFALIGFAALGAAVPMFRSLQPNRFTPVGYLFLVIPAVFGLSAMWNVSRLASRGVLRVGTRIGTAAVAAIGGYCAYEVFVEVSDLRDGRYAQRPPQVQSISERVNCTTEWLENDTSRRGRILFEVFPARGQASEIAYYAYKTNREFIGSPMPEMFFASFVNGRLFGQPIESVDGARFMRYVDLYNIGWIVAHSKEAIRTLERFPAVVAVRKCENLSMYRVEHRLSYFLEGRGAVAAAGFNNLILDGLEGDTIVLKYNYLPGLKSTPPAKIEPASLSSGMPPLIRIVAPPRSLRLYLGG